MMAAELLSVSFPKNIFQNQATLMLYRFLELSIKRAILTRQPIDPVELQLRHWLHKMTLVARRVGGGLTLDLSVMSRTC